MFTRYIEPFVGSGCLAFSLESSDTCLGDLNADLIGFYDSLKAKPAELYEVYAQLPIDERTYYRVRQIYNEEPPSLQKSAHFLYLNRLCFNGIYRVNKAGRFNVPWGGAKVGAPLPLADLIAASARLTNTKLTSGDFEEMVRANLITDAFVYLDPPYARDEARVFREYHVDSFSTADWDRLAELLDFIDASGAKFLLSYAGDEACRRRLERWCVGRLRVTRNVGGFKSSRRKHTELLAANFAFNVADAP